MVNRKWIYRENIEEAEEVCNIVYDILKERKHNESIGIITFNINQKKCIEDCLERKAQKDSDFQSLYIKEIDRVENDEDISLFVKNIENVQGDERDIIIFSIGYAKNEKGRVSVNFGSLSQDGGENRLNVAISRANHSSKTARERDIHRQRYLESRGWHIIRIWSSHWWKNPEFEIERIVDEINKLNNVVNK